MGAMKTLTSVPARDRRRLELLCRYVARPAIAAERLALLSDGRVLYQLRHPWRDGTTHVVFQPLELLEKLAALIPPPRFNLVRYHGVLGPAARSRHQIVPPAPSHPDSPPHPGCCALQPAGTSQHPRPRRGCPHTRRPPRAPARPRNYSWAELMRRVWRLDVLQCPRCLGTMRILAAVHPPQAVRAILDCLGLPSRPPPVAPAAES
jgi:hypothetical protein